MKKIYLLLTTVFWVFILSQGAFGQENKNLKMGNRLVEFCFNPQAGTYSILDQRNNRVCVENAYFQINQFASNQGYRFDVTSEKISDELGKGQKLTIDGKKANQPSLILEVTIYDDRGCIVLNTGLVNTTNADLRIMAFSPLRGMAYKGFAFDDYHALDGENGMELTRVVTRDTLKSRNNLLATFGKKGQPKRSLVIGGLTYHEFQKYASVIKNKDFLGIELKADDPFGKLVDAHSTYILNDKFYIDFTTDNRFEALEKYGWALSKANHVDIQCPAIPILNFWYAYTPQYGGNEFRDNSVGTVQEMEQIVKSGFLKYSPMGLRLEPDDYASPNNAQGWWDDQHWQMYKGGQLLKPYETIVKWGQKITEMGGVPFIYCQTAKRSEDYCLQFPEQTLFNNPLSKRSKGRVEWWGRNGDSTAIYWTYDFTDPGFIKHMNRVYQNLKEGGVKGIKFDYPGTGWSYDGGFEDKYATTTSAYRNIFKLAYDGLGPNRDVQERIPLFGDVALGVVTTQRTEGDNDRVYPARITKTGLRWYKNRMVANYDHDPINPFHTYPKDSPDGWRTALTMTYTTSGRMEIGKYFEKMTPEMLFDLSRVVPLLTAPASSARPIDAFSGQPYPRVYDFVAKPGWHIVTFFNTRLEGEEWPTDCGVYSSNKKQFSPQKMLPEVVKVALGDRTDDGGLGLEPKKAYYVFDFWNWKFVGKIGGHSQLEQELRPGEARIMAVHEVKRVPQFLSTSRHILQGYLDMTHYPEWDPQKAELSGTSRLIADEPYRVIIAANGYPIKGCSAGDAKCEVRLIDKQNSIYELSLTGSSTSEKTWKVVFGKKAKSGQ